MLSTLESYHPIGAFSADVCDKSHFRSQEMLGRYWVINFFFASCEEVCPKVNHQVTLLAQHFSDSETKFVSITVDPENDNDSVLTAYKKNMYDGKNWIVGRMPIDSLIDLSTKKIGVGHLSEPSLHSTRLVLIDKKGIIRGFYDGLDKNEMMRLRNHLDSLVH